MRLAPHVLALILVGMLTLTAVGFAEKEEPAEPDTASASRLYNPPSVITLEDSSGTGERPAEAKSEINLDFIRGKGTGETGKPEGRRKSKCVLCPGEGRGRIGGGGGPVPGYLFADLSAVNTKVKQMGIPELSESILIVGGKGYARIGRFVIGGGGYGGSTESGGIPDCCTRYADIEIAYGGLILGLSKTGSRWEGTTGLLLGGGAVAVERRRNSRYVFGWDGSWEIFEADDPDSIATDDLSATSTLRADFIAIEPFIEFKYWVFPFMALDLSASYLRANIGRGEWKIENTKIPDSPETNIGGPTIKFGLHFGV
jgi:hypothetical protein